MTISCQTGPCGTPRKCTGLVGRYTGTLVQKFYRGIFGIFLPFFENLWYFLDSEVSRVTLEAVWSRLSFRKVVYTRFIVKLQHIKVIMGHISNKQGFSCFVQCFSLKSRFLEIEAITKKLFFLGQIYHLVVPKFDFERFWSSKLGYLGISKFDPTVPFVLYFN